MSSDDGTLRADATSLAHRWAVEFGRALQSDDREALTSLFADDSHWRDLVAFTWDFTTSSGGELIAARFGSTFDEIRPSGVRIAEDHTPPSVSTRNGRACVEVFLRFETAYGEGVGLARLVPDDSAPSRLVAWLLVTQIVGLSSRPRMHRRRARGRGYEPTDPAQTWLEARAAGQSFVDREPEVLIVGAGHAGLIVAAHLRRLGVDCLVVERNERLGDNWRKRYRSLTLHNTTDMNQFPYLSFPPTYPEYLPRDLIANWIEHYADILDIPCWTSSHLEAATYDDAAELWEAAILRGDGVRRTVRPRHIISATGGFGGKPRMPHLAGIEAFAGDVSHAEDVRGGPGYAGKRVLVIGAGASAHDVALQMHLDGAATTMMQRGSTTVVSLESANANWTIYSDGTPIDEADLKGQLGFIHPIFIDSCQRGEAADRERDTPLRASLEAAGLRLDDGEDATGWRMKFWSRGGGYYFDQGCAAVIAAGGISVLQASDVESFVPAGIRLKGGETLPFDAVIYATGYENRQEENRSLFGDEVAERVGPIGGFDESGEIRNAFRVTPQPGLWFMFGGILTARQNAPLVALQICAALDRIAPDTAQILEARGARGREALAVPGL